MGKESWRFPLPAGVQHLGDQNTKSEENSKFINNFLSYYKIPISGIWDIFYVQDGSNTDELAKKYINTLNNIGFGYLNNSDLSTNPVIKSFSFIKKYTAPAPQYDVYYFENTGIMVVLYRGFR